MIILSPVLLPYTGYTVTSPLAVHRVHCHQSSCRTQGTLSPVLLPYTGYTVTSPLAVHRVHCHQSSCRTQGTLSPVLLPYTGYQAPKLFQTATTLCLHIINANLATM
ncbi:hypothetical protein BaRGS_00004926 [Batillaria attramentaria]|uniref:Uncharacterized protein n=1 Tax=Batillaria attramentaria TaxID=370345 RepID=A0ABD0LXH3_9CAEN